MKEIIFLFLILLLMVARVAYARLDPNAELTIISARRHMVYFKVNKSFVGGLVEVYDKNKKRVEVDSISHANTMVHFGNVPAGHYIIKVRKGKDSAEFEYINI